MYVWAGRDTFVVLNSVSVVLFIILQSLDRIPYTLSALPIDVVRVQPNISAVCLQVQVVSRTKLKSQKALAKCNPSFLSSTLLPFLF